MGTQIINLQDGLYERGSYVYCGRTNNKFHYGNPFPMQGEGRRDWACDMFELWLFGDPQFQEMEPERRAFIIQTLFTLEGQTLACYCTPKRCHCDTYVKILEGILPSPVFHNQNALNSIL
jgi:hypothetical protein